MKTYGNVILMAVICIVVFSIFMALRPAPAEQVGLTRSLPPLEYDRPYTGELTIRRLATEQEMRNLCPNAFKNNYHQHAAACSMRNATLATCDVYVVSDQVLKALRMDYALSLRHQLGHCNGWGADHKGERMVAADHRETMPTLPASTKYLSSYPPTICVTPDWKPESCENRKTRTLGPTRDLFR